MASMARELSAKPPVNAGGFCYLLGGRPGAAQALSMVRRMAAGPAPVVDRV